MAGLDPNEAAWVQGVSKQTGIDPRVLIAWQRSEGHPGDEAFNYLNLQVQTAQAVGVRPSSVLAADTAGFANVQEGITASVREIQALGLSHEAGKTPAQAISDIAASPWASSHYGGPGGPNLRATFASIFSPAGLTSAYQGPGTAGEVGATAGTGSAGSGKVLGVGGYDPIPAAKSAVSALGFPERAFRFLTSWRFAEVVGGFFLLLVGLVLLGRQFGLSAPAPPVVSKAADYSIFQAAPGAGSDAHFEANRAYVGSGGASRGDSTPGPRPVYSGRLPAGGVSSAGEIPF